MELGIGVLWIFAIAMFMYAGAHVAYAARDTWLARRLRGAAVPPAAAPRGRVRIAGRVRAARLLYPPASGGQVVAWSVRGSYGINGEAEAVEFELVGDPGAPAVRVDARRLALLVAEEKDVHGNVIRLLRPGSEVVAHGYLDGGVLRHASDAPLVVGPATWPPIFPHLWRAAVALLLVASFFVATYVAHVGQ
jgi:hypothetical protein